MRTLLDILASYLGIGLAQFNAESRQRARRWGLVGILAALLLCSGCATRQSSSTADFPRSCLTPWDMLRSPQ